MASFLSVLDTQSFVRIFPITLRASLTPLPIVTSSENVKTIETFMVPAPDFSMSLLVGIILPIETFPEIISQSLLFLSFFVATLGPAIVIMIYDSFKR